MPSPIHSFKARFAGLLHAGGGKLGLVGVAVEPIGRGVIASQPALQVTGFCAAPLVVGGHVRHDGAVGFIVPAQYSGAHRSTSLAQLSPSAKGLDAVLFFLAAAAMEPDAFAAQGGSTGGVLGLAQAVGKDDDGVAARCFGIFFDTPAQAFFSSRRCTKSSLTLGTERNTCARHRWVP